MKRKYKIRGMMFMVVVMVLRLIFSIVEDYGNVEKDEEGKVKEKVEDILKEKGWEDKVKEEKNIFRLNSGDNDLQVSFKDEGYNRYRYCIDEENKVYGNG
uniref:DUF3139 domain-containing protein n=1 Tax=Staphylococcus epidermidis TaxID=1282 RepID=UPI0011A0362E